MARDKTTGTKRPIESYDHWVKEGRNKRYVKDGKDEDLTAEPEQIRAFRDTWELGIHSSRRAGIRGKAGQYIRFSRLEPGGHTRLDVKVVDDRGIENLTVVELD